MKLASIILISFGITHLLANASHGQQRKFDLVCNMDLYEDPSKNMGKRRLSIDLEAGTFRQDNDAKQKILEVAENRLLLKRVVFPGSPCQYSMESEVNRYTLRYRVGGLKPNCTLSYNGGQCTMAPYTGDRARAF